MIAILDNQDHLLCLLDDYTESNLHTFLQGTAAFFKCSVVQNSEYAQYFKVGNKVSFVWNDVSYHFDITLSTSNEQLITIQADSLTLELRNEDSSAYKANRAMTFKEYLDVFLFVGDNPIVLGINEVADKKLQLEWEGSEDSILARLFSLANKFSAEIEFETVLNKHWGLDKIKLNVYREHDDKHQGVGKRRTDILLEYGHNIETIEIEENINNLKTAIHATGKDGLTPASVLIDERDADGNQLYYSPIGDGSIRAVQARNQFMSKVNGEGYIAKNWTYDTDNPNVLAAQALAELKKLSKVEVTVKIKGYEYLGIGDTILAQDTGYNPVLNLEARISEQDIYFDNPENNTSTFTNVEILKSEVDESLLTRVRELIEENKVYDVQILTSNGYSFKNGFGETTLTARVMDGPKDVTNEFSLTWFKNSTEYAHTASINVQAGSIDELATYLIIAEKDGRERGRNELTVFNVKDGSPGKTPVVHLAWADSSDGSVGFTLELPTTKIPKYRGYYVDYSSVASTNPKLYKWERNPDDAAKVADEAKDKADNADTKADSANNKADTAISTANTAKDTADEASKQTALVNELANTAKELADKANADATEANRLIGLANGEIDRLNTDVSTAKSDLASAEADLNSKIETVKTTLTQDYATKTNLSDTQITLNKTISESVASVKQEMSETYAVKTDLTTLQGEYNSFKEDTAKKISQQVSSIQTIQTDTTEAQKLANDAYSKAQNAVTSATNASSTASSALDKASDATSVANSASQNATNAVASANSAVSTANTAKSNADKAIADVAALTKTVSSQSTKIDQTSNRIEQVASGVTDNLTNNYYQKSTVDSKLSTAVSGITAQYTSDINTKLANYYDKSTMDRKLTIDGQGISTYVKNTQSKLDNLQIGGRNLYVHSSGVTFAGDIVNSSTTTKNSEKYGFKSEYKITRLSVVRLQQLQFNGKRHAVVSFNAYVNTGTLDLKVDICDLGNKHFAISTTNNRYSVFVDNINQYNTVDSYNGFSDFEFILAQGQTLYVEYIMVEYATTPSNHSPAHEDMATLTQYTQVKQLADQLSATVYDSASGLVTKTTQLANSYAIKQLNSSGDILTSLNLNANTSTAEINAKLIRLNGYTKMDDAFVNKLVANSIITNKIKSTEISGDIIKGGTIQGVTLKSTGSGAEPGEVEINDGTISMEKQEVGTIGRFFNRGFVSPLEMTMAKVGPIGGKIGLIRATSFTPSGFNNQALDTGNNVQNHGLFFHYQGLSIESDGANSGIGKNSGLKIFGDNAYIDLKPSILKDPGDDSDPIKMRIIATPNNTFEFRNNYGNIYMFTKNGEQPIANGFKLIYTWDSPNDTSVRHIRMINSTSSSPYAEIQNNAGTAFGMNVWKSDQRLKSNIQSPTQDALATLNQLQVRQFDWKSDNVHEDFGLVAQEVEQILPNAVFKVGDYYQIKDSGLIPVLIGAVQKLSNKVNLLENIIYNTKGGNLL